MEQKKKAATGSSEKDKKMLLSGVLILTVANILVKICGFFYKVPMNSMLGDDMYIVNAAYSIYNILYMISTAGIPVAVSVMVSECRARGDVRRLHRVFRVSLSALLVVGATGTLLMLLFAHPIASYNSVGGKAFLSLCAIAPALLFISVCSVYRGYFQGFQEMRPTAVSEIIESFVKMALGIALVYFYLNWVGRNGVVTAALSVLAVTVGIVLGMLYLILTYRRYMKKNRLVLFGDAVANEEETDNSPVLRRLISIAVPISLSAVMLNLGALVDSQMMFKMLEGYYGNAAMAEAVTSDYIGGAVTLYNMPSILIYPIACSIVPFISAALESGDRLNASRVTNSALRITALISLPCALGMSALSGPILQLIFGGGDSAMAANAGDLLRVLSVSIFLVAMLSLTNALLQANHKEKKPMISMGVGLAVKILSDLLITHFFGPIGAPVSTVLMHITVVSLNFYFVIRYTDVVPAFGSVFVRPFLAALCSAIAALLSYMLALSFLSPNLSVLFAIAVAALVYLIAVFLFRCVTEEDLSFVPKGKRIAQILRSFKLIR